MANIPWLRAVLRHNATWTQPLAVENWPYITNLEVPYFYYKLAINLIRVVKINVIYQIYFNQMYL